jgi:uncharacterized protein
MARLFGGTPMLFAATCLDRPYSAEKRTENRPTHLAFLNALGSQVRIGGALLAEDGRTPIGSMVIFEADVRALPAKDPYSLAELFADVNIRPWRQGVEWSLA